jgi:3'-phosphoadenosine 5'-phosphosulfate sulfotransferase (PAPS reductase)/FAD synthetase
MEIDALLGLLDLVRQAEQADQANAAAMRALTRACRSRRAAHGAVRAARAAMPAVGTSSDGAAETLRAAVEAAAAADVRAATARSKAIRTYRAAQAANQRLTTAYAPYVHGSASGGRRTDIAAELLAQVVAMPVQMLRSADVIAVQSSAGKDSVVTLHLVKELADAAGVLHKVVIVHCDLGEESEWPGVPELARRQAARYGLRFITVRAENREADPGEDGTRPALGLLGLVERRGLWPDAGRRLCTATLKRAPADVLVTALVRELGLREQALVLVCMGIRAGESAARAKKDDLLLNVRISSGNRMVLTWHPAFRLSEDDVWRTITDHALEYHEVYDALLPRLSCVFCVLAGRDALVRAARICFALGLEHPRLFAEVESRTRNSFKEKLTMAEIIAEARRLDAEEGPLRWERGDAIAHRFGAQAAADYLARLDLAA